MNALEQSIIESIKIIAQDSTKKSNLPKTIECEIIKVIDEAIGLYNVSYMGNDFNVYSSSPSTVYDENDIVLVLVPEGDFSKTKYILGAISPSGNMYAAAGQGEQDRIVFDVNLLPFNNIDLCSYTPTDTQINFSGSEDYLSLLGSYINDFKNLTFTAKVKTQLPGEQQVRGNYKITLNLPILLPSSTGVAGGYEQTWAAATMGINTMEGDVYNFSEFAQQSIDFTLPESAVYDTSRTPYIQAVVENFIQRASQPDDIFFTDIGVRVVDYLPLEENNGNFLTIVASEGNFFTDSLNFSDTKTLSPVLRIDGKDKRIEDYECFWFVEDASVKLDSDGYQYYGGEGWRCLNQKTNVETNEDGAETFQWVTNEYELIIHKDDIFSTLNYKCVLVKDKFYIKGEIEIKNLQPIYFTDLKTKTGTTHFNKNTGTIELVARIWLADEEEYPFDYNDYTIRTYWERFDKNGDYIENAQISKILINNWEYDEAEDRVYMTTEVSIPCSSVDQLNLIKCTFYQEYISNGILVSKNIATNSISVTAGKDFVYKIAIETDKDVYKYDANGNSPMVSNYDGPVSSIVKQIKPIYFRVFDSDGKELSQTEYKYCDVTWQIPKNSMITYNGTITSESDDYIYIKKNGQLNSELYYGIRNVYDNKRDDNTIVLTIDYQGYVLREIIPIRFLKDGESGTNGGKYSAVITYEGRAYGEKVWDNNGKEYIDNLVFAAQFGWYGTIRYAGIFKPRYNLNGEIVYNRIIPINENETHAQLDVTVYKDGNALPVSNDLYTVEWSMFDENVTDPYCSISSTGGVTFGGGSSSGPGSSCTIVQAKIIIKSSSTEENRQEELYTYYPIDLVSIDNPIRTPFNVEDEYNIPVMANGFWHVEYAQDGTNPKYDSAKPFEMKFQCRTNVLDEFLETGDFYAWSEGTYASNFIVSGDNDEIIRPKAKYDNGCSNNIVCWYPNFDFNEIESLIDYKTGYLGYETRQYNSWMTLLANFDLFLHQLDNGENFSYNNYKGLLDNSKKMLEYRSYIFSDIKKLSELLNIIDNYCSDKTVTITPTISDSKDFLDLISANLFNLGNCDAESRTDFTDIYDYFVTAGNTQLTLENESSYKETYGLGSYAILKDYISQVNELLTLYFQQIIILKTCTTELTSFVNFNILLDDYVNNNDVLSDILDGGFGTGDLFYPYQAQLSALFNSLLSLYYSYDDIYNKVLKEFYKYFSEFKEPYYYNVFTDQMNDSLERKTILELELADLNSLYAYTPGMNYYRPILFIYNRYEMSNLNNWDGNKIYIDEYKEQYILAPQMGAGFKESDNSYTGLVMGINTLNYSQYGSHSAGSQKIGLLGLDHGIRTLFLNAKNGSAIFGKSGSGQVIIDPTQDKAMLYSSNYWNYYDENTGLPRSYNSSNITRRGMLINLTDSYIHFGDRYTPTYQLETLEDLVNAINYRLEMMNVAWRVEQQLLSSYWENYVIYPSGNVLYVIISSDGRKIGFVSFNKSSKPHVYFQSDTSSSNYYCLKIGYPTDIYTGSESISCKTFCLTYNHYLQPQTEADDRWWSGSVQSVSGRMQGFQIEEFHITTLDYYLRPVDVTIYFDTNTLMYVHPSYNDAIDMVTDYYQKYLILGGKLYSGIHETLDDVNDGFYISKDGISVGSKFKVTDTGILTLGAGAVSSGAGAHWTIDGSAGAGANNYSYIAYNTDGLYFTANNGMGASAAANQVYLGTNGIRLGNQFAVTDTGYLYATSGTIGGWSLGANSLSANNITISSNGNISGLNWNITSGSATFNNLTANGSGSIGGWTIGSTTLTSGNIILNSATGTISGPGFTLNSSGLNLTSGILNLGSGNNRLYWDGSTLTVNGSGKFTGNITATSGTIGGCVINNGVLEVESANIKSISMNTINACVSDPGQGSLTVGSGRFQTLSIYNGSSYDSIYTVIDNRIAMAIQAAIQAGTIAAGNHNHDGVYAPYVHGDLCHSVSYAVSTHRHTFSGSDSNYINVQGDGTYWFNTTISGTTSTPT